LREAPHNATTTNPKNETDKMSEMSEITIATIPNHDPLPGYPLSLYHEINPNAAAKIGTMMQAITNTII
jgi:hypothetical protein